MTENHTRTEYIFHLARQHSNPEKRAECLDNECGGDTQLRAEVERQLAADARETATIDTPTAESDDRETGYGSTESAIPLPPAVGSQVGNYILKERIAVGGMGAVYVAEQTTPIRRMVAIKFPRRAKLDNDELARFKEEWQSLAKLQHRNIATVFDAGLAQNGQPYFVMELIRGTSITKYCQEGKLCVADRLALFLDVCWAIRHAHEKGIVHRDIKPENILVQGPDATVKVIDFGVAKEVEVGLAKLGTLGTGHSLVGTREYMSPEQARPGADGIDERSDVYSLGILLYELIVGCTPFRSVLNGASLTEFQTIVCERHPIRPSARIRSSADRPADAANSWSTTVPLLRRELRRDLDWITLKALRKQREDRYQSVDELATDVLSYLRGEPIHSRAQVIYRLKTRCNRWVAQHAISTHLLIVALLVPLIVSYPLSQAVYNYSPLNRTYEKWVASAFPTVTSGQSFQDVRIIGIDATTDFEALAAREGIDGISQKEFKSWRRMHGRLMQKLAHSRCRAVVFAIKFEHASEFDESFVEGAEALAAAGIDVVVAVHAWWLNDPGIPVLSSKIIQHVKFGSPIYRLNTAPYVTQLVAQRGSGDPEPSLVLAAYASYRRPRSMYDLRVDQVQERVSLHYWRPIPSVPSLRQFLDAPDEIGLTRATLETLERSDLRSAFDPQWGLLKSDMLGFIYFDIPSSANLRASTISYRAAFSATPDQLAEMTRDKVVIVADLIPGKDSQRLPDGRVLPRGYAQGAALQQLINGEIVRMIHPWQERILWLICAAIGWAAAAITASRHVTIRVALGVLLVVGCAAYCIVAYRGHKVLINPITASGAFLFAYLLCTWAVRERLDHESFWRSGFRTQWFGSDRTA